MTDAPSTTTDADVVGSDRELDELRDFFDNASVSLHWVDAQGVIVRANKAELELLGYAPEEYIGHHIAEFHTDVEVIKDILARLDGGEVLRDYPARLIRRDGSLREVLIDSSVYRHNGEFIHTRCITRDNTDRARQEAALRDSEDRWRLVMDALPAMVFVSDTDGVIQYCNRRWLDYSGLTAEQTREDSTQAIHPDDREPGRTLWLSVHETGEPFATERRIRRHDGEYRWHQVRALPMRSEDGSIIRWLTTVVDVHDRRVAEQAVRKSELRYRSLAESFPAMVTMSSRRGRLEYCNDQFVRYSGLTREQILAGEWTKMLHPDDIALHRENWQETLGSGQPHEVEYRARRADGVYRWHLGRVEPVKDADGRILMWIAAHIDIHDRRIAEEALQRANQAKDEFLGLVSHELKTPLTTIFGNAEVLRLRAGQLDEETRNAALSDISAETERLHRIVENLLVLARLDQGESIEMEPMLVRRLVSRISEEHVRRFPHRTVNIDSPPDVVPVDGSPVYMEQVIRNLLSNAEKYSPPAEPIDIVIEPSEGELRVCVRDRGEGLEAGEEEKIFAPFYRSPRTAGNVSGVGVGLAVCRRLVESQGGRMWARRRDGGGAEIGFLLPVDDGGVDYGA